MNLTQITSAQFKQITRLLEEKEACLARVAAIDHELAAIEAGAPPKAPRTRKSAPGQLDAPGVDRARRGELKDKILALLKEAGATGITVKDIAGKLGINGANVHAWFANTGRKLPQIQNIDGRRVWVDAN
jgi:hypothetical protein